MRHFEVRIVAALGVLLLVSPAPADETESDSSPVLLLNARTAEETEPGSGRYHRLNTQLAWKPSETAIVVCDMWDKHWCPNSTARVAEMAPRMNEVIKAARRNGVLIIHCPSDTLDFYQDTPQRKLAQSAPKVETEVPLQGWCHLDPEVEGAKLPIDDADGGCDCEESVKSHRAWSRQHPAIEIAEGDAITDNAEAFYLMKQRGITNVIVMGVHTNMCVLGRPFSIRQMVQQGQNVVLMRDMTDTMYNPKMAPFVSHFTGTDLVVEHIEKFWCPTILSTDFVGGDEFRFDGDSRPHLAIVIAEREYETINTLPEFAATKLGHDFRVSFVYADADDGNVLPGLEVLNDADIALISVRRRTLRPEQLQIVRDFVAAGKPIVGIRTANHAFLLRGKDAPEGYTQWLTWDRDIFGGRYSNHYGKSERTKVTVAEGAADHPILNGVDAGTLGSVGTLYVVNPLHQGARPLLIGAIPGEAPEPIAFTNTHIGGGRAFYTSLGHPDDFEQPAFHVLLRNALRWAADLQPSE